MALPDPISREDQYLSNIAGDETELPDYPVTRSEKYLAKIAGEAVDLPDYPVTREEQYLAYIAEHGGGGGVTVEALSVTENGTYTAPSGKAYSPVTVNVPSEEPTLQDKTVTENGTVTADAGYDGLGTVTVNVSGGGGGGAVQDNMIVINGYYLPTARQVGAITLKGTAAVGDYFLSSYKNNGSTPITNIFGALTTITLESKPVMLSTKAFYQATSVTTVNVPWSQGEVAGAPWGATNATINYNYVG